MEPALIARLRDDPDFAGVPVSAISPNLERDGARAIGVNVDTRPPMGSLSTAIVTISVVCPRQDEAHFHALVAAAHRGVHGDIAADGRSYRIISMRILKSPMTRTTDGYLHCAIVFDTVYKEHHGSG